MKKITIVIRIINKTGSKIYDFENLEFVKNERILNILNTFYKIRPRSKLEFLLKFRIAVSEVSEFSKKRKLLALSLDTIDILLSLSPPAKQKNRINIFKK